MKVILFVLARFCCCTTYSQTLLKSSDSLVRTINKSDSHTYKVKITKGNFYKLAFIQNGIDIQIELKHAHSKDKVYNSSNEISGTEQVEFLAASSGYALLSVTPLNDQATTIAGEYTLKYIKKFRSAEYARMLKQKEAEQKEFVGWIKKNAVPLQSVKPGSGFGDLELLKTVLMNKRVVALGEATHGTKEFFQMKHRLLELLVTQLGFSVFAIEASYGRCKYVNDYVLNGKGNLDTATIIQGFIPWSTEEVRDVIQWMRIYNEVHPDNKVQFVGFDLQLNDAVAFAISNYYKRVDTSKTVEVDTLLKKVNKAEIAGGKFSADTTIKKLISHVEKLIANFINQEGEYVLKTTKAEYDEILWSHKILHQYLISYYNNNFSETEIKEDRDFYMAQNVLAWLSYFPKGTKMILWAHNGHIAKDFLDAVSMPSMGSYLKALLKDDYYAIGFDFYKGKFQSNDIDLKNAPGWEELEVGEAPEGYLGSYFVKAGLGNSFLDFSRTVQNGNIRQWLNEKVIGTYSMGSRFSKKWSIDEYTSSIKLNQAFDGVIFIKESTRAVPLKSFKTNIYEF